MTVKHLNFYENIDEAHRRLLKTIVLYEGKPYIVLAITNHKTGGVFRIYLDPIDRFENTRKRVAAGYENYPSASPDLGVYLDAWMEQNKDSGLLRKKMDSPHFDKFRPFPLGMCNYAAKTYYVERQPIRAGSQGLTRSHIVDTPVSLTQQDPGRQSNFVEIYSAGFKACILGDYPDAKECLSKLSDPEFVNEAAAFDRNFALIRGPIDMFFLGYKQDVIGVLPRGDFSELRIGKKFKHTKEAAEGLKLFENVITL